jgi:ATP-dependent DNA helicase RecG
MADYVWREYPSNSLALINRWLAYRGEYGNA